MNVNLIDVGLGNLSSIEHWIKECNLLSHRVKSINQFTKDPIIIPGVASAGEYMKRLANQGLDKEIIKRSMDDQKIIGICLGFQIMTHFSEEDSGVKCLGILDGKTTYISNKGTHNGWKKIKLDSRQSEYEVFFPKKRLKLINGRVYFNHELKVELNEDLFHQKLKNGITSFAFKKNIFGVQFHPEKSQNTGREILKLIL